MNEEPDKEESRYLSEATIAGIRIDRANGMAQEKIAEKYGVSRNTVIRYIDDVDKHSLANEIIQVHDERNREKIIKALEKIDVNADIVAGKIKELLNDSDPQIVWKGVAEYNKIMGNYKDPTEKKLSKTNKTMNITMVQLPERK